VDSCRRITGSPQASRPPSFFNLERTYFHVGVFPSFYGDDWTFHSDNFRLPSKYFVIPPAQRSMDVLGWAAIYRTMTLRCLQSSGVIISPMTIKRVILFQINSLFPMHSQINLRRLWRPEKKRMMKLYRDEGYDKNVVLALYRRTSGYGIRIRSIKIPRLSVRRRNFYEQLKILKMTMGRLF